ncbi:hypothetical protein AU467_17490 [Mesorhizobium loti]|uniref:Uncharacterized protein n=1 Tax=Rhizobium loti TaxID=381 RepID=A0A101KUZ0_RHILI|nr:hypothetical protein AU467_17490 [Mesorhizobium loti]
MFLQPLLAGLHRCRQQPNLDRRLGKPGLRHHDLVDHRMGGPRLAKHASGQSSGQPLSGLAAIKAGQYRRKQITTLERAGKFDGPPAHDRIGMLHQITQPWPRINAMVPKRREAKCPRPSISSVEPLGHEWPQIVTRRARDCAGQARHAGFAKADTGVDCRGDKRGLAATQCQST